MTVVGGPSAASQQPADSTVRGPADVPVRADGVQLIGEMQGSGYREPPSLARRGDGQTVQLTALLQLVLAAVDGQRTYDEVAEVVSQGLGRRVTADNVRTLVDGQLRPHGLVCRPDGTQPEVKRSNPLLALKLKYAVTDPARTERITAPFAALFHPLVVLPVLALLAWTSWYVLFREGLASATHEAFSRPGLLVLVVVMTVLSAGFHEFGHAAGARRGGAVPGVMGAGIYLVWPAFYTDVTDSYRLGRGGRLVTDLGGLYFNAIVAVATVGVWRLTSYDALLLVVATQLLQMVRQLLPLVRFDGYHVLADLTGVPDLFQRIRPTLLGLLPWHWKDPENRVLKPWARLIVTAWVLVVVPLLAFSLWCLVLALPRMLGTAWAAMAQQANLAATAWGDADVLAVVGRSLATLAVTFPILAVALVLSRLVRRLVTQAWVATRGRPVRRGLAGLLALALVAGLTYLWWPQDGRYRPIQPWEGGTLTQAVAAARPAPTGLQTGATGTVTTAWPADTPRPTAERPQLAVVLVPRDGGEPTVAGTPGSTDVEVGATDGEPQPWVFPFDRPLAPGPGDNQAMAANTRDGTAQYDVAFALVWVEDDSAALNTNEAYAFASCRDCAAVAVAFQVVLVTGDNSVAVPRNLSAAVNSDCVGCLTYALATQLFVTLDGPVTADTRRRLDALWAEIAQFGRSITTVPLSEIQARLTAYEEQILDIVGVEKRPGQPGTSTSARPSPSPTGPGDVEASSGTAPSDAADPSGTGGPSGSTSPSPATSTPPSPAASPTGDAPSSAPTSGTSTSPSASPTSGATP